MKTTKISSTYILKEASIRTEELKRTIRKISSGKIDISDSPTDIYLSSLLKDKIERLDTISQHLTRSINTLQKYEDVLDSVTSLVEDMKLIAERATQVSAPDEFKKLEKAYSERFLVLKEVVKRATFFGRSIALGGFSNAVTKINIDSGDVTLTPPDINVSGVNFRKYGVQEFGYFQIKVTKTGDTVRAELIVNNKTVIAEERKILIENYPITVDFEEMGFSINLPSPSDFSATIQIKADPMLIVFGEGEGDVENFFLPSLEPEMLGLKDNFSEGIEISLGRIKETLEKLSEIRATIGEKMQKFASRSDMNSIIQTKHKILGGYLSDADIPSEAVILSLKQNLLQAEISLLQRTIAILSQGVDILRK